MNMVLIGGRWLDGSAWDEVVAALEGLGHCPIPVTLPGQGDRAGTATLEDQAATVLSAIDSAADRPLGWTSTPVTGP